VTNKFKLLRTMKCIIVSWLYYLTISWLYTNLTDEDKFSGEITLLERASLKNSTGLFIISGPWLCRWFNVKRPGLLRSTLAVAEQNDQ